MSGPQKVHPKNDTSYEGFHDPSGALELDPEEEALVSTYFKSDEHWARIYVSLRMTQKSKPEAQEILFGIFKSEFEVVALVGALLVATTVSILFVGVDQSDVDDKLHSAYVNLGFLCTMFGLMAIHSACVHLANMGKVQHSVIAYMAETKRKNFLSKLISTLLWPWFLMALTIYAFIAMIIVGMFAFIDHDTGYTAIGIGAFAIVLLVINEANACTTANTICKDISKEMPKHAPKL